ncbi:MAG: transglutaminase domain-containing protein [Desulfobacula sp.]|nr:transglutaminase domain-containing protein [Desulfobacula sp.]
MKKFIILIVVGVMFVTAFWLIKNNNRQNSVSSIETIKHIKYSFTIRNKTNKLLNDKKLWVYAPVKRNSFQSCSVIESKVPFQLTHSANGNQIISFTINDLSPFGTRIINVQASIVYRSPPRKMELDSRQLYLLPELHIESTNLDIINLAKTLQASTVMGSAKNIYNWVSSNIEYTGYIKNSRGALYALKHKKGDCTEFMSLFVALCRANNIPARGIGGYTCTGDCILTPSNYHNWAEVYVDGSWLMADCQKKVFAQENENYIAMQIIADKAKDVMQGFSRFRFQGTDLKVKMN